MKWSHNGSASEPEEEPPASSIFSCRYSSHWVKVGWLPAGCNMQHRHREHLAYLMQNEISMPESKFARERHLTECMPKKHGLFLLWEASAKLYHYILLSWLSREKLFRTARYLWSTKVLELKLKLMFNFYKLRRSNSRTLLSSTLPWGVPGAGPGEGWRHGWGWRPHCWGSLALCPGCTWCWSSSPAALPACLAHAASPLHIWASLQVLALFNAYHGK